MRPSRMNALINITVIVVGLAIVVFGALLLSRGIDKLLTH